MEYDVVEGFWGDAGESIDVYYEVNDFVRANGANKVTEGLRRIPLRRFEDERGWFMELMRASLLPKPVRQSNVSFSRAGRDPRPALPRARPGRPLRLPQGTVRVVVLDRESGETFTEDIGDDNPVAIYVPGCSRTATRR